MSQVISLDDEPVYRMVNLISNDGKSFSIRSDIASQSVLIKEVLDVDTTSTDIPLGQVNGKVLEKAVIYMNAKFELPVVIIEKPVTKSDFRQVVPEWDADFVDVPNQMILDMLEGANYLHIDPMMQLCAAKMSVVLQSKTIPEIREIFGLEADIIEKEMSDEPAK